MQLVPQIIEETEAVKCVLMMLFGAQSWLFAWDESKEVNIKLMAG
jgi:hypothetical protein